MQGLNRRESPAIQPMVKAVGSLNIAADGLPHCLNHGTVAPASRAPECLLRPPHHHIGPWHAHESELAIV